MNKQNLTVSIIGAILMLSTVNCSCPGTDPAQEPSPSTTPAASQPTETTQQPVSQNQLALPLTAAEPTLSKEELIATWEACIKDEEKPNLNEAISVARSLANLGPEALGPVLDTLADPQSSQLVKITAAISIKQLGVVPPTLFDRLMQMAKPENENITRACAVDLLGSIINPKVEAILSEYINDPDRLVRLKAICGLARFNQEGCKALIDLWKSADLTDPERSDIVISILNDPSLVTQEFAIEILQSAMQTPAIDENIRIAAIKTLGQFGKNESLAPLAACAEKDPSQKVKEAAKNALDAITSRVNASNPNPGS